MLSADDTAIYAAYQAGDLDFIDTVPTDQIASLNGIDPEFYVADGLGTYYASFNVKSPHVRRRKSVERANAMRRAFAMLVDRQYIIDTIAGTRPAARQHLRARRHGGRPRRRVPHGRRCLHLSRRRPATSAPRSMWTAPSSCSRAPAMSSTPTTCSPLPPPSASSTLTNEGSGNVGIAECIRQESGRDRHQHDHPHLRVERVPQRPYERQLRHRPQWLAGRLQRSHQLHWRCGPPIPATTTASSAAKKPDNPKRPRQLAGPSGC